MWSCSVYAVLHELGNCLCSCVVVKLVLINLAPKPSVNNFVYVESVLSCIITVDEVVSFGCIVAGKVF